MSNRIRQLREEAHMTQVRLGVELEVSQETISAYEKQKHNPSFAQLQKMACIFHASIDYIMGISDVRNPVHPVIEEKTVQLLTLSSQLNEKQLDLALAYIQGLIDMNAVL